MHRLVIEQNYQPGTCHCTHFPWRPVYSAEPLIPRCARQVCALGHRGTPFPRCLAPLVGAIRPDLPIFAGLLAGPGGRILYDGIYPNLMSSIIGSMGPVRLCCRDCHLTIGHLVWSVGCPTIRIKVYPRPDREWPRWVWSGAWNLEPQRLARIGCSSVDLKWPNFHSVDKFDNRKPTRVPRVPHLRPVASPYPWPPLWP